MPSTWAPSYTTIVSGGTGVFEDVYGHVDVRQWLVVPHPLVVMQNARSLMPIFSDLLHLLAKSRIEAKNESERYRGLDEMV